MEMDETLKKERVSRLEWVAKNYGTGYSRMVSHFSTDPAITGLTSEIRRDPVLFRVYGRSWQ